MCGAFTIRLNPYDDFIFLNTPKAHQKWNAIYNARPGEWLPIVTEEQPKQITNALWGFLPHWMDLKKGRAVINARGETLAEKPYFRSAAAKQRCIIPADGFYEWQLTTNGKIPHYFHKKEGGLFSFAGVYDVVPGKKDELGFAIITTTPNSLVAKVHDRMPVILEDDAVEDWLNPDMTAEQAATFLKPFPASKMASYIVSRAVNMAKNKGAEVVEPVQ